MQIWVEPRPRVQDRGGHTKSKSKAESLSKHSIIWTPDANMSRAMSRRMPSLEDALTEREKKPRTSLDPTGTY